MIAILDYGAGNTRSVLRAFAAIGADAALVSSAEGLGAADRLVVPGVGAAGSAVDALMANGLWEAARAWGLADRPLLGVCLGAQLLLDGSDEGDAPGLGLVRGRCRAFPAPEAGGPRQVPHIGWNEVRTRTGGRFDAYFVHGYWPDAESVAVAGTTTVDRFTFPSLLRLGSLSGTQFHPEKSGPVGRAILRAFATGRLDGMPAGVRQELPA